MAKTKKEDTEQLATTEPAGALGEVIDYGEGAGEGFENFTKDDLTTPFIYLLQSGSPTVKDAETGHVPGKFYNTATGDLYEMETGVVFVPIHKVHDFVEWRSKAAGGGVVARHAIDSDLVLKSIAANNGKINKDLKTADGNDLKETQSIYAMILSEDGKSWDEEKFAVIPLTSTKLKPCRKMFDKLYRLTVPVLRNGRTAKARPPLYAHRVRMVAYKTETNGEKYVNVDFKPLVEGDWRAGLINPQTEAELFADARGQYQAVVDGKLTITNEKSDAQPAGSAPETVEDLDF